MAYPLFVSTLYLWNELECSPLGRELSSPLPQPGRAVCALAGTERRRPWHLPASGCAGMWGAHGWRGQGHCWSQKPALEMQVLMLVLAPWSGISPLSLCKIHLGYSVERSLAFPCTQAHAEQCFKVKKVLFLAAKKTYKWDQKGPSALATRNENKGWFKIPCFWTALINSLKISDGFWAPWLRATGISFPLLIILFLLIH